MGIGQVLTMPLFFASNAIYPVTMMPAWLQTIDVAAALTDAAPAPHSWRCLICGYDEPASEVGPSEDAPNLPSF